MKQRDALKAIKNAARKAGVSYEEVQGGSHMNVLLDGKRATVFSRGSHGTELGTALARKVAAQVAEFIPGFKF